MIVDVHSHAWAYSQHFGDDFRRQAARARAGVEVDLTVRYEDYRASCPPDTRTIVFGGKAKLSGMWVDDRYVADYIAQHSDTLEYGVWDKVLLGTDYPFTTVNESIAGKLNEMLDGTKLPRLDGRQIERKIHRESLPILGLA